VEDFYQPAPDTATCPHCGTIIRCAIAIAAPISHVVFKVTCPQCRHVWSEYRDAREYFRAWTPAARSA
jgi:hypothetical protein